MNAIKYLKKAVVKTGNLLSTDLLTTYRLPHNRNVMIKKIQALFLEEYMIISIPFLSLTAQNNIKILD